jgi:hypothetical protein
LGIYNYRMKKSNFGITVFNNILLLSMYMLISVVISSCGSSSGGSVGDLNVFATFASKITSISIPSVNYNFVIAINKSTVGHVAEPSGLIMGLTGGLSGDLTQSNTKGLSVIDAPSTILPDMPHTISSVVTEGPLSAVNYSFSPLVSVTYSMETYAFKVRQFDSVNNATLTTVTGKKKYGNQNSKCLIYVDKNSDDSSVDWAAIGTYFDEVVYPKIMTTFVPDTITLDIDVDNNGKVILLYYDFGNPSIGGIVSIFDLLSKSSIDKYNGLNTVSFAHPLIQKDILYFNLTLLKSENVNLNKNTIAHEFQHLVSNHLKLQQSNNGVFTQFELWIEEGLSESASHMCNNNQPLRRHIQTVKSSEAIRNGEGFIKWNSKIENYALSYLFFQYSRIHSSLGDGIFKKIQEQSVRNYKAIETVMTATNPFFNNFDDILRSFHIATIVNSKDTESIYGFKTERNNFDLGKPSAGTTTSPLISPGGRIVLYLSDEELNRFYTNPSSENIYYYSIQKSE